MLTDRPAVTPSTFYHNDSVHARMTGAEELTISVMIDYPLGRRWTHLYRGDVSDARLRALLVQLEGMVEAVRDRLGSDPADETERWYDGIYSTSQGDTI